MRQQYKPCKKCLLSQTDMTAAYKEVRGLIEAVPKERRVSEEIYSARLSVCTKCGELNGGVCAKCGCYVELRAVYKRMYCPADEDRWEEIY